MSRPWVLDYDTENCTIGAALAIVGEKWTFLVLREAFNGVRRFDDIRRRIGAPRQILSDRLARLVEQTTPAQVYQRRYSRAREAEARRHSSTGPSTKRTSLEARGWRRDLHRVRRFASMRRDSASLMSSDNSFPVLAPIPGPATVPSAMESRESREPVAPHCQQAPAGAPRKPRQRQFPQRLG